MAERLDLVKAWSELSAGMIVVVKLCDICGGNHREMLLSPEVSATRDPKGHIEVEPCFPTVPGAHSLGDTCIVEDQVAQGFIYRVVDGLESAEATTHARKKERADGR